jgi:hypothetical protein
VGSSRISTSAIRELTDIPAGKLDAGRLAHEAAAAVAPDEVSRSQRPTVGQPNVDTRTVLLDARHVTFAKDRHAELLDPAGEDALELRLRERETVVVASGKVADVEGDSGEALDLHRLPGLEEPVGDAALVEHFDRACVQAAGARADKLEAGTPLHDDHVDFRQGQLARQHHPGRAASGDHHRMVGLPGHRLLFTSSGRIETFQGVASARRRLLIREHAGCP